METFKLHPEQREIADAALSILKENNIVYLAMEMRTGKTPTSMTIAKEYGAKKVLFVTKLKAISGIQEMATHFDFDLTITNYESTHKVDIQPDLVILDEAHCLGGFGSIEKRKGHFTKPYQALVNLCRQKPIIYLSGTPSPESYTQLYFQFYLSSYSPFRAYSNFYKWAKDYVNAKEKRIGMRTIKCYDEAKPELYEKVKHLFISLKQTAFKNKVVDIIVELPVPVELRKIHDEMRKKRVIKVGETEIIADTPATLLQKRQQILSGHIIDTETGETFLLSDYKAKYISEMPEQKIAIFYKYKAERQLLLDKLPQGSVTESHEEFQSTNIRYFIGQIQSIREGVKLDKADCIVIHTQDFSAVSYAQSRARIQTRDREGTFYIYYLQAEKSMEADVYEAVANKKNFTATYYKSLKEKS
jgi:hypothetical protein